MTSLEIDWAAIHSPSDFFDVVLRQMQAPEWHGRNLDALNDSWVTGDICPTGPPFRFRFRSSPPADVELASFAATVREIAEASVHENGGDFTVESAG